MDDNSKIAKSGKKILKNTIVKSFKFLLIIIIVISVSLALLVASLREIFRSDTSDQAFKDDKQDFQDWLDEDSA